MYTLNFSWWNGVVKSWIYQIMCILYVYHNLNRGADLTLDSSFCITQREIPMISFYQCVCVTRTRYVFANTCICVWHYFSLVTSTEFMEVCHLNAAAVASRVPDQQPPAPAHATPQPVVAPPPVPATSMAPTATGNASAAAAFQASALAQAQAAQVRFGDYCAGLDVSEFDIRYFPF